MPPPPPPGPQDPSPPPPSPAALMPDCGVHYLWFAFVCFLIRSRPPSPAQTQAWPYPLAIQRKFVVCNNGLIDGCCLLQEYGGAQINAPA